MNYEKLKPLVNDPVLWGNFKEWVDWLIDIDHRTLEQATDLPLIYRTQGRLKLLKNLKKLREEINGLGGEEQF